MKKFLQAVVECKTWACMMFTGSIILYTVINFILGIETIKISMILSILIVSALGTFIQFFAFSEYILKKVKYSLRMIIFVVPFLIMLTLCALLFNWFPTGYAGSWIIFIGIFLAIFIILTVAFEIYFRITGKKYDGILGQFRRQNENNKIK